jgi:hypothetical protein
MSLYELMNVCQDSNSNVGFVSFLFVALLLNALLVNSAQHKLSAF